MIEQNEDTALKSKLLTRIIIAVALILVAILVLTLVQHFNSNPPPKVTPPAPPAPKPAPPVAPPKPVLTPLAPQAASAPQSVSAPQAASMPAATLSPEPVVTRPAETQPEPAAPIETPPPPAVSNVAPEAKTKTAKKAVKKKTEVKEKKAARREAKMPEEKGDFSLQFGVFSSSSNSEKMISMLKKKGVKPAVDYRVLAGPYPDKESAEKEKTALGGNLVSMAKGYALQVGDFSSQQHADALVAELKKKGAQVVLETRIRAGRYVSRSAALEEARKLGIPAIAVRR